MRYVLAVLVLISTTVAVRDLPVRKESTTPLIPRSMDQRAVGDFWHTDSFKGYPR